MSKSNTMKPIPIAAARRIAEAYGYDQVVVVARNVDGGEHCTAYYTSRLIHRSFHVQIEYGDPQVAADCYS